MTTQRQPGYVWLPAPPTPAPPHYIHLSERHTRSQDLDQRSSEKQRHQMESQGVPAAAPSSAHAQSCRHMACARVKPKREPAGAPALPAMLKASQGHQSRTQLPTERPAAGCAGGPWGFRFCSSLFSTGNLGRGEQHGFVIFTPKIIIIL